MFKTKREKEELPSIIVPTFYSGGTEPLNPREGSVWYNDYEGTIYSYLGNKWFKCLFVEETEYTEQQIEQMEKEKKQKESEEKQELEKYRKFIKSFKEFLNEEAH